MGFDRGVLMVVETGALQLFVFQGESERLDQMQPAAGVGAEADDIAGVGRDFRLVQDNIKHCMVT